MNIIKKSRLQRKNINLISFKNYKYFLLIYFCPVTYNFRPDTGLYIYFPTTALTHLVLEMCNPFLFMSENQWFLSVFYVQYQVFRSYMIQSRILFIFLFIVKYHMPSDQSDARASYFDALIDADKMIIEGYSRQVLFLPTY